MILQRPALRIVTVLPATLQTGVVEVMKVTGKLDDAVAEIEKGRSPKTLLVRALNVMDWLLLPTLKFCGT